MADPSEEDSPVGVDAELRLPYADIREMAAESDTVVHGRILEVVEDTEIDENHSGHSIFTVDVEDVLAGDAPDEVRVAIWTHEQGRRVQISESAGPIELQTGDSAIWFLLEVEPQFEFEGYVITNTIGLVYEEDDGSLNTVEHETPFAQELAELESLDAARERISEHSMNSQ